MNRKQKLILVFIDNTGIRLTGRYRDRLMQYAETEAFPEARATVFSDDTPERRAQLIAHVAKEAPNHEWMGWFSLPNTNDVLQVAKRQAFAQFA